MEQVTIQELAANTFGLMERVERGETIEIIKEGRPIARIVPISPPGEPDVVIGGVPVARPGPFTTPTI